MLADPPEFRFGGGPKHLAVLEVDGGPQAYAIYRLNAVFGSLGPETRSSRSRSMGATPAATASIWRYLLDIDWTQTVSARLQPVDSPLFLLLARPELLAPGDLRRALDAAGRRRRRALAAHVRRRRGARPRRPRRVLPVERGPLAGRAGRGGAHHRRGRSRARRRRSRSVPTSAGSPSESSSAPAASRSCGRARSPARTGSSARTSRTVVPRDLLVRAELGRPHHGTISPRCLFAAMGCRRFQAGKESAASSAMSPSMASCGTRASRLPSRRGAGYGSP